MEVPPSARRAGRDDEDVSNGQRRKGSLLSYRRGGLFLVLAVLHASPVYAETGPPKQMAEVTVAAEDDDVDAFLAGIREPLEELGFAVRASGGGDESGPTTRTDSSATRVHVVVRTRLRMSVSTVPNAFSCRCSAIPSAASNRFAVK